METANSTDNDNNNCRPRHNRRRRRRSLLGGSNWNWLGWRRRKLAGRAQKTICQANSSRVSFGLAAADCRGDCWARAVDWPTAELRGRTEIDLGARVISRSAAAAAAAMRWKEEQRPIIISAARRTCCPSLQWLFSALPPLAVIDGCLAVRRAPATAAGDLSGPLRTVAGRPLARLARGDRAQKVTSRQPPIWPPPNWSCSYLATGGGPAQRVSRPVGRLSAARGTNWTDRRSRQLVPVVV